MYLQTAKLAVVGIAIGLAVGIGLFTFVYAKGYSYMSNDPAARANCHVMNEQYNGWQKSSHKNVATCNDCHTPHDVIGKYSTKASNGFWHSYYFTFNNFHEPIQITERNRKINRGILPTLSRRTDPIDIRTQRKKRRSDLMHPMPSKRRALALTKEVEE